MTNKTNNTVAKTTTTATMSNKKWLKLRQQVLERDKYTCRECGCTDDLPYVHHIVPRREGGTDSLDNLITLCSKKCGKLVNSESEQEERQLEYYEMLEKMVSYNILDNKFIPTDAWCKHWTNILKIMENAPESTKKVFDGMKNIEIIRYIILPRFLAARRIANKKFAEWKNREAKSVPLSFEEVNEEHNKMLLMGMSYNRREKNKLNAETYELDFVSKIVYAAIAHRTIKIDGKYIDPNNIEQQMMCSKEFEL